MKVLASLLMLLTSEIAYAQVLNQPPLAVAPEYGAAQSKSPEKTGFTSIDDRLKQDGLIDESHDSSVPIPFGTANEGIAALTNESNLYILVKNHPEYGIVTFRSAHKQEFFEAFVKGNLFYPSVVRVRYVVVPGHIELRRSILCGASKETCAALMAFLNREDHRCGKGVRGCPGYQALPESPRPLPGQSVPPPPPPPALSGTH
ncbi:hypothetical protein [Luteibacter sp. HA06]